MTRTTVAAFAVLIVAVAAWFLFGPNGDQPGMGQEADPAPETTSGTTQPDEPEIPPLPADGEPSPAPAETPPAQDEPDVEAATEKADVPVDTSKPVSAEMLLKETMVTFEWSDTNALAALAALAAEIGAPIVVPDELRPRLERGGMSLSFKELSAESALELLLALADPGYTWETKDGKILIVPR